VAVVAPARSVQAPPSGEACHWSWVGAPDTSAVKTAVWPTVTVVSAGWVVKARPGPAGFTVSTAGWLVTLPAPLDTVTVYDPASEAWAAARASVAAVAPRPAPSFFHW